MSSCHLCNELFDASDLLLINQQSICIRCKSRYIQGLKENVGKVEELGAFEGGIHCPNCNQKPRSVSLSFNTSRFISCQHCDARLYEERGHTIWQLLSVITWLLAFGIPIFIISISADSQKPLNFMVHLAVVLVISFIAAYLLDQRVSRYFLAIDGEDKKNTDSNE